MGCGSSTAARLPLDSVAVVATAPASAAAPAGAKSSVHRPPITHVHDQNDDDHTHAVVSTKKKSLAHRNSSGPTNSYAAANGNGNDNGNSSAGSNAAAASLPAARSVTLPCDADSTHPSASVWCSECEQHLCEGCDGLLHAGSSFVAAHNRTSLTGAPRPHPTNSNADAAAAAGEQKHSEKGEEKEMKNPRFVLRGNPANILQQQAAAAAAAATAAGDSDETAVVEEQKSPSQRQHSVKDEEKGHGSDDRANGTHSPRSEKEKSQRTHSRSDNAHNSHTDATHNPIASPSSTNSQQPPPTQRASLFQRRTDNNDESSAATPAAVTAATPKAKGLNQLTQADIGHLSRSELEKLWNVYDRNHSNSLNKSELKSLADDCIDRQMKLLEDDLALKNPHLSPEQLKEKLKEERVFLVEGKSEKESRAYMRQRLLETLDLNHDGKITKQEFLVHWNAFAQEVFQLQEQGAIECSIM